MWRGMQKWERKKFLKRKGKIKKKLLLSSVMYHVSYVTCHILVMHSTGYKVTQILIMVSI